MPFLVLLLSCRPVELASTIRRHVETFGFVHVVVIHAPLQKHVLAPWTPLPIATIIGARRKHRMAILQIRRQHGGRCGGHHLQIAEKNRTALVGNSRSTHHEVNHPSSWRATNACDQGQ